MSNELDAFRDAVAALARGAFGDRSEVRAMTPLAGDASSRRYARITLAGAGPGTAVLMIAPGSGLAISSEELAVFAEPLREMPFLNVQRYLRSVGVAVPEVYANDAARGLVLLEDVGDTTLWEAARAAADPAGLYRSAIDGIVDLQIAGRDRRDDACIAFAQRFDPKLFLWELDHFLEYGFRGRPLVGADRDAIRGHFEDLAERLGTAPPVLAHRDYHGWNLFVLDGRIRVIDFQDALLAPASYDLASLLTDRMTPTRIDPRLELALVDFYCDRRGARAGEPLERAAFRRLYFETALQRALKVVGRFHYLEEVKGKRGYVAMLPDTIATVRRSLENLPALAGLRALLARSFPEIAA